MYFINLTEEFPKRYDMSKFMEFEDLSFDVLMSYMIRKVKSFRVYGYYDVSGEEGRPDLVSFYIYDKTMYWWILMIYNDLIDPDQVVTGMRLKYPSMDEIEELYFTLNNKSKVGL